jgi:hypothetical protein
VRWGGVAQTPHTFSSSAKSQTVSGLIDGTSYTFTVLATNAVGSSAPASPRSADSGWAVPREETREGSNH